MDRFTAFYIFAAAVVTGGILLWLSMATVNAYDRHALKKMPVPLQPLLPPKGNRDGRGRFRKRA